MTQIKALGELINWVDCRNSGLQSDKLLGINIDKKFMPSVANIIGTDLTKYKLISENQFACNPMHVGRDEKMPIALYKDKNPAIVSPAYFVFEVKDRSVINPEYLMLWFSRPEFDRECWFHTDGSVRGGITWDEIIEMIVPIPTIEEQEKIVAQYNEIERRIEIKRKINDNLLQQAQVIYETLLIGEINYCQIGDILTLLKDGTHNPPKRVALGVPLITGQTVSNGFITYDKMTYIDENDYYTIHKYYQPIENDLILTKIGTVGKVAILRSIDLPITVHCNSALLRFKSDVISQQWGFFLLNSSSFKMELKKKITNTVQDFVSLANLADIVIPLPKKNIIKEYDGYFKTIIEIFSNNDFEIQMLANLRGMLLPQLISSENDVSNVKI